MLRFTQFGKYTRELLEPPHQDDYPDPEANMININNDKIIPENQRGRILRDELCRQLIAQ